MLLYKLAAVAFVAAVLSLALKKEQPAFAFLVSVCAAAGILATMTQQMRPVMEWLQTLDGILPGGGIDALLRVMGIALVAQLAGDLCREAGMSAAATAAELCGRLLALLQALPLLQELLSAYAGYLQ